MGDGFADGCFKVYGLNINSNPVTKKTCEDHGHFLGNERNPIITVIDTPGFYDLIEHNYVHQCD